MIDCGASTPATYLLILVAVPMLAAVLAVVAILVTNLAARWILERS